jgi:preprotein translocase SecE subunit
LGVRIPPGLPFPARDIKGRVAYTGGAMKNVTQFLNEVSVELSRIEWPSIDEWIGSTIVALIIVAIFAMFFGSVDRVISLLAKHIFSYGF